MDLSSNSRALPVEQTEIKVAIEQFQITNVEQQKRLIARRAD
jgi:hypothetical protein